MSQIFSVKQRLKVKGSHPKQITLLADTSLMPLAPPPPPPTRPICHIGCMNKNLSFFLHVEKYIFGKEKGSETDEFVLKKYLV